ncbi:2506_t:CDS:10 [Cetraspora pellucida]|uniref:2506_t:CDS:1 n=1 Tax=Cetraspora pellucida TaxID=1433469 RepID=A0A9N9G6S8_9GLOM|nr:2506_t:CDS:10 [Cetraspora pellucida]
MQSSTRAELSGKLIKPTHGAKAFKEKFVEIYENFFKGNDPSTGQPHFWSELFLLKVNAPYLTRCLTEISQDQLLAIKACIGNINKIFLNSIEMMKDETSKRKINAIETLCILLQGIFVKKFNNFSSDVINLLTGLNNADTVFTQLVDAIKHLLEDDETVIKYEALRLAIVVVCGNNNINQNSINEFFMRNDIFDPLIKIIIAPETSYVAYEAIMLLGILANYNKHESKNPYMAKIIAIKDETVFKKILDTVASTCKKCRNYYIEIQDDEETYKYSVSSALSYVGAILPWGMSGSTKEQHDISDPDQAFNQLPSANIAILLVYYDFVNNNKGFVAYISKSIAEYQINSESETNSYGPYFLDFLSFASYLVQHNRSARTASYVKLSLLVLLILTEDVTFDSRISDERKSYYVRLCRQRQPLLPSVRNPRPLVCAILDISLGFINHNMRKKLQIDLYSLVLGIIQRIMLYHKKFKVVLSYHWSELWHSLIGLLKFIHSNYDNFQQDRSSINEILISAITTINLCISFGDSFFPDAVTYDKLFYEIVRSNEVFEGLSKIVNIQDPVKPSQKFSPTEQAFVNINTICQHFHLKIEAWKAANRAQTLLPEQVLAIINANYDSLNLITPEKLDNYTSYSEIPYHVPFVRQVLRLVVEDFKRREVLLE